MRGIFYPEMPYTKDSNNTDLVIIKYFVISQKGDNV